MTLTQIKEWINNLPDEFLEFEVVGAEFGEFTDEDESEYTWRLDKPVLICDVSEDTKEILFVTVQGPNKE